MTNAEGLIDLAAGLIVVGAASKMLKDVEKPFHPKRKPIRSMKEGKR